MIQTNIIITVVMLGTEQRIRHFMSLPVLIAIIITRRKQQLLN